MQRFRCGFSYSFVSELKNGASGAAKTRMAGGAPKDPTGIAMH